MMQPDKSNSRTETVKTITQFLLLMTVGFLIVDYVVLRRGRHWGEVDTRFVTLAIKGMYESGKLVPDDGSLVYPAGYAYQVISTFILNITGISLSNLQIYGGAFLSLWLILPAWLAYRELTGTNKGAFLATLFIIIQPEFLFPILRGTHEKFTRGLMFLCLYLLVRSIRSRRDILNFSGFVITFYLATFAMITFNNLMATSFIATLAIALLVGLGMFFYNRGENTNVNLPFRRLIFAIVVSIILSFVFTFYAYRPAVHNIYLMQSVWDRLAALFLDVETVSTNPYAVIGTSWVNIPTYILVSLSNWILLFISVVIWGKQLVDLIKKSDQPSSEADQLLWSLYSAIAVISAVSILVDVSGAIASNLQHRVFPSFAMLASPMVAKWLEKRYARKHRSFVFLERVALMVLVGFVSVLSVFKASNEPLLSNKWLFYTTPEVQAVEWAEENLTSGVLWAAHDERVHAGLVVSRGEAVSDIEIDQYSVEPSTTDYLISDVIRSRSIRLGLPLPIDFDSYVIYDNGQAQIYHKRPVTPYQP